MEVEGIVHFSVTPKGIAFGVVEIGRALMLAAFIALATLSFAINLEVSQFRAVLTFISYAACGFGMYINIAFMFRQQRNKLPLVVLCILIAALCAALLKLAC